jgi:hypothetical protein
MNVLVGCEESQAVCKAFRALGHNAFSCDLQECSGGHPEWHIRGDVRDVIKWHLFYTEDSKQHYIDLWDTGIFHPPCKYFSRAAGRWLYNPNRLKNTNESFEFFMELYRAPIFRKCLENPPGWLNTNFKKATQKIHPWYFGDNEMKETCLWLINLPKLQGLIEIAANRTAHHPKPLSSRMGSDGKIKNKYFVSRMTNAKDRAKTFPGVARAMAEQWGRLPVLNRPG